MVLAAPELWRTVYLGMDKHESFSTQAVRGMREVARVVAAGYGPRGSSVMLDRAAGLLSTRDGVTIAREVCSGSPEQRAGAALLVEASLRTNEQAGDATSATALLGAAVASGLLRAIEGGHHPAVVAQTLKASAEVAAQAVAQASRPVEDFEELEDVARVAAGGDPEIARALRDAITMVGQDGTVTIEAGLGVGIEVVIEEGTSFQTTLASQDFLPEGGERVLLEPLVAVVFGSLRRTEDVLRMLELAAGVPNHPLLLLAEDVSGDALRTCVMNDHKKILQVVAARPPGIGAWRQHYLGDMAALAGADLVDPERGDDPGSWQLGWFGMLKRASVTKNRVVLHAQEEASGGIESRRAEIAAVSASAEHDYDRDRHAERIAALGGSLCVIKVGGVTEAEARARRTVVEDALCACRGALEDGVIPGGGAAYLLAAEAISGDDSPGGTALREALHVPFRLICERSSIPIPAALASAQQLLLGGLPPSPGVFDSTRAVCAAILNAASAASMGACAGHFIRAKSKRK